MNRKPLFLKWFISLVLFNSFLICCIAGTDSIPPRHKVTLPEAHTGTLENDTRLLDSYAPLPDNIRDFYLDSRSVFSNLPEADFTHRQIIKSAQKNNIPLMGGPLLGNLSHNEAGVWMRPSTTGKVQIRVTKHDGSTAKNYRQKSTEPGKEFRMVLNGLDAATEYLYAVLANNEQVAEGRFTTAPVPGEKDTFRLAFGSCFHKIGIHNPNLMSRIVERKPHAMMLLGDIAADDRENHINMHRADYLLRDVSKAWQMLAANVPLYASWDDHDYLDNDLSGVPERFTDSDREALRKLWGRNWNNPENPGPGIWFSSRVGPVEIIMPDTRSCREIKNRGQYGSYLGLEQMEWLKKTLKNSTAPFKIISSGTMWSDYITNGKDSWGTWDAKSREELFQFIIKENITGVLLISGDRHGARGFAIPGPAGTTFYEFEAASLGGVPGPEAMANDSLNQLFGYHGTTVVAFGEFTFNTTGEQPFVTFRLIAENGFILEKIILPYSKLMHGKL